jgi:putative transposase
VSEINILDAERVAFVTHMVVQIMRMKPENLDSLCSSVIGSTNDFLGWIDRNRRRWKNTEAPVKAAKAFLDAASIMLRLRRLAQESASAPRRWPTV